ncbi:hypothetical protein D9M70_643060 [compost metagenome]
MNVSRGIKLPMPDGKGADKSRGALQVAVKREASGFLQEEEVSPAPAASEAKSVLFSFKIGTDDLDSLRRLSERDGESVAVLLRQAVRDYLRAKGVKR